MEHQLAEIRAQTELARTGAFEATVFRLIDGHRQSLMQIEVDPRRVGILEEDEFADRSRLPESMRGPDAVGRIYRQLLHQWEAVASDVDVDTRSVVRDVYSRVYDKHHDDLGQYFRVLFNAFRFILDASPSHDAAVLSGRLMRAQLSDTELVLLFYNCLSSGGARFAKYAEAFRMFHNMPKRLLLDTRHVRLLPAAFSSEPRDEVHVENYSPYQWALRDGYGD